MSKNSSNSCSHENMFTRTAMLLGEDALAALREKKIILFGLGGVGSWCADALIRSGLSRLTIVDCDYVCPTNINRQLEAIPETLGAPKTEALKEHLLRINPDAVITAVFRKYHETTRDKFNLHEYDYIIDAIDTLSCKVDLIASSLHADVTVFSAMGAARKLNPASIRVSDIWDTRICPLAKMVRKRLRKRGIEKSFTCVWSDEAPVPHQPDDTAAASDEQTPTNGSMVFVTGTFGFTLASLVVQDVLKKHTGHR